MLTDRIESALISWNVFSMAHSLAITLFSAIPIASGPKIMRMTA